MWQVICSCAKKSSSFIIFGENNSDIYNQECVKKRPQMLAKSHNVAPLFWIDLASTHYDIKTLDAVAELNIEMVSV